MADGYIASTLFKPVAMLSWNIVRSACCCLALAPTIASAQVFTLLTDWPEANGEVLAIEVDEAAGVLYFAGSFTQVNGLPRGRLAAVDLATGALLPWAPMADNSVQDIVVAGDSIIVTGGFTEIDGQLRSHLASIDASTGILRPWSPELNNAGFAVHVHQGLVYVGGLFSTVDALPRSRLATFDPATGGLTAFDPFPSASGIVRSIVSSGANLMIGGNFTAVGGASRNNVAELDVSTGLATSWIANTNNVHGALYASPSAVLLGGQFTLVNGTSRIGVGEVSAADGTLTSWDAQLTAPGGGVRSIARVAGIDFIGGFFSHVGGVAHANAAALDPNTGALLTTSFNANSFVHAVAVHADRVFLGGAFTSVSPGGSRSRFAAFSYCVPSPWYADSDDDGFGDASSMVMDCAAPSGYVANDGDCDDNEPLITGPTTWYLDADGDGFGSLSGTVSACIAPSGFAALPNDCDDTDFLIFPGAACDDGDPLTGNDLIQPFPACNCAGESISLSVRLFLQGPFSEFSGMMDDDLRIQGLIPLTEPYTALGYDAVGTPSPAGSNVDPSLLLPAPSVLDDVVDWVILELRDGNDGSIRIATRYVLVKRFGHVIDLDGSSTVRFPVPPGNYRLAVLHRNHRGVVMAAGAPLNGAFVDFTDPNLDVNGGAAARVNVGFGHGLFNGDVTFNDQISYVGPDNDRDPILFAIGGSTPTNVVAGIYSSADVNMDGTIKYTGSDNDRDRILSAIGGLVPTNVLPNAYLHTTP